MTAPISVALASDAQLASAVMGFRCHEIPWTTETRASFRRCGSGALVRVTRPRSE